MSALIKAFAAGESGAVTVDWVVLTAAIMGLGLAVVLVVGSGVENLSNDIAQPLADQAPSDATVFNTYARTGVGDIAASGN